MEVWMKYVRKIILLTVIAICSVAQAVWSAPQPPDQPRRHAPGKKSVLVGRVSVLEGEMLRYVHENKDWVPTVKDSPFGREDALYLGENSRAEFLMPNGVWIRAGANTQIQMVALKDDLTEVDVAAGIARFINRGPGAVVEATTPYGYAIGAAGSIFDVYAGEESVEIVAIKGKVEFVHDLDGAKYNVIPRSMSILADNRQAAAGDGKVDAEWDEWNISRDSSLARGIETKGESINYLPEGIRENAAVLDENGRWERVYYEGEYREAWCPTSVEEGWAPYTVGHWTDWDGDYNWVPYESFGYVTHHYGYWFRSSDRWYWAPPVASSGWGSPHWGIGLGWYPGRVGWIYSDDAVGWFPLLPWEPFYAFNWWGPWGFTVYHPGLIGIDYHRYGNWDRAVVVNQSDFHNANSYSRTRLTNRNGRTVSSDFRAAPVVGNNLLKNAGDPSRRFNYSNAAPHFQPSRDATSRVVQNLAKFKLAAASATGKAVRSQVAGAKLAKPAAGGSVTVPRITSGRTGTAGLRAFSKSPGAVKLSRAGAVRSSLHNAIQSRRGGGQGSRAGNGSAGVKTGRSVRNDGKREFATGKARTVSERRSLYGERKFASRRRSQRRKVSWVPALIRGDRGSWRSRDGRPSGRWWRAEA